MVQSFKEFTKYTKGTLAPRDVYALMANLDALGIDEKLLVENAGSAVAHALRSYDGEKLLFVCGKGGKGAIGMSVARHMLDRADVSIAVARNGSEIKNSAAAFNYELLSSLAPVHDIDENGIGELEKLVKSADVVVDALIGIGLKGKPSKFLGEVIKATSRARHIVSIDVPAGVNANTGIPNNPSISADEVFTIHKNKKTSLLCKKPKCKSCVMDVGIPVAMELMAGPGDVMLATEPRSMRANKYDTGAVLVVGGSAEYHGAPLLSAFAALRTGSGYVTLAAPKIAAIKLKKESPNLAVRTLPGNTITRDDVETILRIRHDSMAIGSGMSPTKESFDTILEILRRCDTPIVLDAAALRAAALDKSVLGERMVLTPHEGEFEALTGIKLDNSPLHERIRTAVKFAGFYGCTLVLKGNDTIITDGKLLKINKAASPALATMGTGDALSGMIASYLSKHKNVFECAVAAVHAHASAGDILSAQKGIHITATDVVDAIPDVLKTFDVIDKDAKYGEVPVAAEM